MRKVFPSDHEYIRCTLRDFRVIEGDQRWIARLRGEGKFRSAVFPELDQKQVLVELIPLSEWRRPSIFFRWAAALRLPYLTISLLPLLLVLCARFREGLGVQWAISVLLILAVTCIHLSCNLWSDFEDHLRGVDNPGQSGGSGVIHKLWIPAVHLRNAAATLFLVGCAFSLLLLTELPRELVNERLLWLGLVGAIGAASFSGWPFHYKYLGAGEPIIFLLCGPLLTAGAAALYFSQARVLERFALLSLPLSFLVTLRLHCGNMQRIPFDTAARVITIARLGGFSWSKRAYSFLVVAPYLFVGILVSAHVASAWALLTLGALPFAFRALKTLRRTQGPLDPACYELRAEGARLHWAFGLLYCASFLI